MRFLLQLQLKNLFKINVLKVDEKGTETAAVTKVVMTLGIEKTAKMVVDKPFLFLLCNKKQMNKCFFIAKIEKI